MFTFILKVLNICLPSRCFCDYSQPPDRFFFFNSTIKVKKPQLINSVIMVELKLMTFIHTIANEFVLVNNWRRNFSN